MPLRVNDDTTARAAMRSFISAARPDAVLTGSDKFAVIVYSVAAELNLTIGRDLAVLGFDGSVGGSILHPALTSVVLPVEGHLPAHCQPRCRADRERPGRPSGRGRPHLGPGRRQYPGPRRIAPARPLTPMR